MVSFVILGLVKGNQGGGSHLECRESENTHAEADRQAAPKSLLSRAMAF